MKALFCGDISPTPATGPLFGSGDYEALFTDITELFQKYDAAVVNLECALTEHDTQIKKIGPPLKAPIGTAKTLKDMGVTHCAISNNHFFDYGAKGALDTIKALDEAGLIHTGFGMNEEDSRKDLVIKKNGETLCVIAVCEHEYSYALPDRMGCRPFDEFETPLDVRAAKEKYDRVVVLYHGGKEQCAYPSPRLRKACHAMAKSGADLILCQHSHCIGCYEELNGSHILYGQGNFHFIREEWSQLYGWNDGFAAVYDSTENTLELIPVTRGNGIYMRYANPEEAKVIFDGFEERSKSLQDGTWMDGWVAFCESKRDSYTQVLTRFADPEFCFAKFPGVQKGPQQFGHYLDCEAHQDVWRTLFPTYNRTNEK